MPGGGFDARPGPAGVSSPAADLPLAGVRVLLLGYVIAGPLASRFLANHGADVLRVEWTGHLDRLRHGAPNKRTVKTVNSSGRFGQYNSELKSVGLNLRTEHGRALFLELIKQTDVFVTNLGTHVLPGLGLGGNVLFDANPRLVVARLTLFGPGAYGRQPGLGGGLAAYAGFFESTGWPDGEPVMPQGAYTDFIVPPLAVTAILAALEDVRAGGRGRMVDVSQFEFGSWFLMPQLLGAQLASTPPGREGSFSDGPGLTFATPCAGDDRWCTVSIEDDAQWRALCAAFGCPELAADSRFRSVPARFLHRWELSDQVFGWTRSLSREELVATCRSCGILAVPLADGEDLMHDAHLAARGHWREVERCDNGRAAYSERFPISFSAFEAISRRAPDFGEHTYETLAGALGRSEPEIAALYEAGAIE